jgi:hypothetical protein
LCANICINFQSMAELATFDNGAHGVVVSHPLSMREALGSIPSVSMACLTARNASNILFLLELLQASGSLSEPVGSSGGLRESLGISGSLWEPRGTLWMPLGTMWELLGASGNFWEPLGAYGSLWEPLGFYRSLWEAARPLGTVGRLGEGRPSTLKSQTPKPKPPNLKPQSRSGELHPSKTACPRAAEVLWRGWNAWQGWKVELTFHPSHPSGERKPLAFPKTQTLNPKRQKPKSCSGEPHPSKTGCPEAAEALLKGCTGWNDAVLRDLKQCGAVRCGAVRCGAVQCCAVSNSTLGKGALEGRVLSFPHFRTADTTNMLRV